jgi:hypothetical protein
LPIKAFDHGFALLSQLSHFLFERTAVIGGAIDLPLQGQELVICALISRVANLGCPGFLAQFIQQRGTIALQAFEIAFKTGVLGFQAGSGAAGSKPGAQLTRAPKVDHQAQVSQQEHNAQHDRHPSPA